MSRTIRLCLVVLMLLAPVASASAQRTDRVRQLRAEVDSLTPILRAADSIFQAHLDSVKRLDAVRLTEDLDSVLVGPFMVVARPQDMAEAEAYVSGLWTELEVIMRGSEPWLRGITFLIERGTSIPMFRGMAERPRHSELRMPIMLSESARRTHLMRVAGQQFTKTTSDTGLDWLGGAALSWEDNTNANAYRELATARGHAAGGCFANDVAKCRDALGLEKPDSLWSSWYSPVQLRQIVIDDIDARHLQPFMRNECVKFKRVDSCAAHLRTGSGVPWPLTAGVRANFLTFALSKGGEGSFARLLSSKGDVSTRIAAASRRPIDQLVEEWRRQVQLARPDVHAGITKSRLAILFWVLCGLGLAMRSTRWRIA